MARYFDIDKLAEMARAKADTLIAGKQAFDYVAKWLDLLPAADVAEVKHGAWLKCQKLYGIGYEYVCSVCHKGVRQYNGQPICSECGAIMDERRETE